MADDIDGKIMITILNNEAKRSVAVVFEFASDEDCQAALKQISEQADQGYLNMKFKPRGGNA